MNKNRRKRLAELQDSVLQYQENSLKEVFRLKLLISDEYTAQAKMIGSGLIAGSENCVGHMEEAVKLINELDADLGFIADELEEAQYG